MKRPYKSYRAKMIRRSVPRSKKSRALLYFIHEAAHSAVKAVESYSFFLNYQRAIMRHGWAYAHELKEIKDERELRRRLSELRRRRFIEARRVGKRIEFKVTDRGALALHLDCLHAQQDGGLVATLLIFDIPESERRVRDQIRQLLKQAGFQRFQQSVWLRRADVYEASVGLIRYLGAEKWVTVARTADPLRR